MHQPKKLQLKHRASTIKRALIDAGTQGMQVGELLALVAADEPNLTRDTLAVWIADHQGRIQAMRGGRTLPGGYFWYHRGVLPKAREQGTGLRSAPSQRAPRSSRVITVTLPALPRLTRLRVFALVVTVYAVTITALEVL